MRLDIGNAIVNIFSGRSILTNQYTKYYQDSEYIIEITDFFNVMERYEKIKDWRYETFNENRKSHSYDDLPAIIIYDEDREVSSLSWYKDGEPHRDNDEPAEIQYDIRGRIRRIVYYKNGRVHRNKINPADISYDELGNKKVEKWYINGIIQKAVYYDKYGKVEKISEKEW